MSWQLEQLLDAQRRADCDRNDFARRADEEALALCGRLTRGELQHARERIAAASHQAINTRKGP